MPHLTINGQPVTVEPGATVLEAARQAGIAIPSMCYLKGLPHLTSCMVCVVKERISGRLLPSCSARATGGMVIETEAPEARHVRTASLNLLMSEHAGDCTAPCTTTCPAHLNIPLMIRQIAEGKIDAALATTYDTLALPAVLGRICTAPCEKACRRGRLDAPLSICLLERFAAEAHPLGLTGARPPATGKRIAVIGAGPAGLAAAFHLARSGHACMVFDDRGQAGGQLRYGVPEGLLPATVLDLEIRRLQQLGVTFQLGTRVGRDLALQQLKAEFHAIVLAIGHTPPESLAAWGVTTSTCGIQVEAHTFRTSDDMIFAGGEVVQPGHLTARAVAHGKALSLSIQQFLQGQPVTGPARRFESRLGRIRPEESREMMKEASPLTRLHPVAGPGQGFTSAEATQESGRCMHCDCRKAEACKLRDHMEAQVTGPMHVPAGSRKPVERNITHAGVIFEPGKCIKCGLCVSITAGAGEKPGLAFLGRGFDAVVGIPFGASLQEALGTSAGKCVAECPTGALAWKKPRQTGRSQTSQPVHISPGQIQLPDPH